jgi:hypothetical protein
LDHGKGLCVILTHDTLRLSRLISPPLSHVGTCTNLFDFGLGASSISGLFPDLLKVCTNLFLYIRVLVVVVSVGDLVVLIGVTVRLGSRPAKPARPSKPIQP